MRRAVVSLNGVGVKMLASGFTITEEPMFAPVEKVMRSRCPDGAKAAERITIEDDIDISFRVPESHVLRVESALCQHGFIAH